MGNTQYKIGEHAVTVVKEIAVGGFSYVYLCKSTSKPLRHYALKKIHTQSAEQLELARQEVEAHRSIRHEGVLQLLDHTEVHDPADADAVDVLLLFPYYPHGSLHKLVLERRHDWPWSEEACLAFFLAVCEAVRAVHQRGYTHRDIKPHNILLSYLVPVPHASSPPSSLTARLAELSLPRPVLIDLGSLMPSPLAITSRSAALHHQDTAAIHTTQSYRPPELSLVPTPCTLDDRCDVWMLGCTLYLLSEGEEAERGRTRWGDTAHSRTRSKRWEQYVDGMLKQSMDERFTLDEVIRRGQDLLQTLSEPVQQTAAADDEEKVDDWANFDAAQPSTDVVPEDRKVKDKPPRNVKERTTSVAAGPKGADDDQHRTQQLEALASSLAAALSAGDDAAPGKPKGKRKGKGRGSSKGAGVHGAGPGGSEDGSVGSSSVTVMVEANGDEDDFGDFASAVSSPTSQVLQHQQAAAPDTDESTTSRS